MSKKSFVMLASLFLLCIMLLPACGDRMDSPSALPESSAPQISASPPEIPQATDVPATTPAPTARPVFDPGDRRPERPFPAHTGFAGRFFSVELYSALSEGSFVIEDHALAVNYQAWHAFIERAGRELSASLYIYHCKTVPEDAGMERYQVTGRGYLRSTAEGTVWYDFEDSMNTQWGALSVTFDPDSSMNEVRIDDEKVFEFIYAPADPAQIALYYGFVPLGELPHDYTSDEALADGCLLIQNGKIQNGQLLSRLPSALYDERTGQFLRIYEESDAGVTISDVGYDFGSFSGRVCLSEDSSRLRNPPDEALVTTYYDNCFLNHRSGSNLHSLMISGDSMGFDNAYIFKDLPFAPHGS